MAAAHWRHRDDPDWSNAALEDAWLAEFGGVDTEKYSLEMARAISEGYRRQAEFAPLVPGTFIPIMIEERIEVPIANHILTFKIDRMMGDGTQDKMVFVDTKTAGRLGAQWAKGWDISLQMKLYKLGVYLKWGKVPDGVIEGVLKKVPTRIEYVLLPEWDMDILREAEQQFMMIANQDDTLLKLATRTDGVIDMDVLWNIASTLTPFNDNDCYAYGRPCPFLDVCNTTPSERLPLIKVNYETYEPDWT